MLSVVPPPGPGARPCSRTSSTCVSTRIAAGADAAYQDGGCLLVVPGSQGWPTRCTQPAVPAPAGLIGHYIQAEATQAGRRVLPAGAADGPTSLWLYVSEGGGLRGERTDGHPRAGRTADDALSCKHE
jgi:hypothetical protein